MLLQHQPSTETISGVLSCTHAEYAYWFHGSMDTDTLCHNAHRSIEAHRQALRDASQNYRLDDLLTGMLNYAISNTGRRYVAVVIHIAHTKGEEAVVNIAKAWMEHLFFPSQFNFTSVASLT